MKIPASLLVATTLTMLATAAAAWGWGEAEVRDGWGFSDDFVVDFSFGLNFSGRGSGHGRDYNDSRVRNGYGYYTYGETAGVLPVSRQVADMTAR